MSLIPGSGRSSGGGPDNPFQYFCRKYPMKRGALGTPVHEITKSQTKLKWLRMCAYKVFVNYTHCFVFTDFYILPLLTNIDSFLCSEIIDSLPFNNEKPIVFTTEMDEIAKIFPVVENVFITSKCFCVKNKNNLAAHENNASFLLVLLFINNLCKYINKIIWDFK